MHAKEAFAPHPQAEKPIGRTDGPIFNERAANARTDRKPRKRCMNSFACWHEEPPAKITSARCRKHVRKMCPENRTPQCRPPEPAFRAEHHTPARPCLARGLHAKDLRYLQKLELFPQFRASKPLRRAHNAMQKLSFSRSNVKAALPCHCKPPVWL